MRPLQVTIPYEAVDCEIRQLVRLLNAFPGIRTEFSCAGHTEDQETYVSFQAESHENLETVLAALPFTGARCELVANQFRWRILCVDVALSSQGELRYTLRIAGQPEYIRRRLVGEVEQALATALAGHPTEHPSCPMCVAARSMDS